MSFEIIEGEGASNLSDEQKWEKLGGYLQKHGRNAFSYATLQKGMEYFIDDSMGYVAYSSVKHPIFAPKGKKIVLGDPVCSRDKVSDLTDCFLENCGEPVFTVVSESCAESLRGLDFKINSIGYEPVLDVQNYNTKGDWKKLDAIRRARNQILKKDRKGKVLEEKVKITEEDVEKISRADLEKVSKSWHKGKILNKREIWIYARNPVYSQEQDVRKFFARTKDGELVGYAFYDPIYEDDSVVGYSANTVRCDESNYRKLSIAINMVACEKFKDEGVKEFNLCIAPFDKTDRGKFNDHAFTSSFIKLLRRYGDRVYNFGGLSFYKGKYRAEEKQVYMASRGLIPANDLYLAFKSSDIAKSYMGVVGNLLAGMVLRKKS